MEALERLFNNMQKNPNNVDGKWYITDACVFCNMCGDAPNNITNDGVSSWIFKQPDNASDENRCTISKQKCPVGAIRDDYNLPEPAEPMQEVTISTDINLNSTTYTSEQ